MERAIKIHLEIKEKGRILCPKWFRDKLGAKEGDIIELEIINVKVLKSKEIDELFKKEP